MHDAIPPLYEEVAAPKERLQHDHDGRKKPRVQMLYPTNAAQLAAHGTAPIDGTAATGTAVSKVTAARMAPAMGCERPNR